MKKGEWLFAGIYKSINVSKKADGKYKYETELLNISKELIGKLIIRFNKEFRQSYLLLEKFIDDLEICEITRKSYEIDPFPGFDEINVSYNDLKKVYAEEENTWKSALSNVNGIYLVTDRKTGKLYVGKASGDEAFWQRWNDYIKNGHGGNEKLKQLIENHGIEYASNFSYSILEICNKNTLAEKIDNRESHWKNILWTRGEFGNNGN